MAFNNVRFDRGLVLRRGKKGGLKGVEGEVRAYRLS